MTGFPPHLYTPSPPGFAARSRQWGRVGQGQPSGRGVGGWAHFLACDNHDASSVWLQEEVLWGPRSGLGPSCASRGLKRSLSPVREGTGAKVQDASIFPASRLRFYLCSKTSQRLTASGGSSRWGPSLCLDPRLMQRQPRPEAFTFDVLTIGVKAAYPCGRAGGHSQGQEHPADGSRKL